jgi:hypothetical protein
MSSEPANAVFPTAHNAALPVHIPKHLRSGSALQRIGILG